MNSATDREHREQRESLRRVLEAARDKAESATRLLPDRPHEDGGTSMLNERLWRAVTNQIDAGPSTLSRYGIWAITGRDHLAAALEHLEAGRVAQAQELVMTVANSLAVFAVAQRALDPHFPG